MNQNVSQIALVNRLKFKHLALPFTIVLGIVVDEWDVIFVIVIAGFLAVRASGFCINYYSHDLQ